jgi:hypothetical protein
MNLYSYYFKDWQHMVGALLQIGLHAIVADLPEHLESGERYSS